MRVPSDVLREFGIPEVLSRLRSKRQSASRVSVPETPVHEDCFSARPENNVRLARQFFSMEPISVAEAMQEPTDDEFRLRVLASHPRHKGASFLRRQRIQVDDLYPDGMER
jgi:hypothetical protein